MMRAPRRLLLLALLSLAACHTSPCDAWCDAHADKDKQCGTTWWGDDASEECKADNGDQTETAQGDAFCNSDAARVTNESCAAWSAENDNGN